MDSETVYELPAALPEAPAPEMRASIRSPRKELARSMNRIGMVLLIVTLLPIVLSFPVGWILQTFLAPVMSEEGLAVVQKVLSFALTQLIAIPIALCVGNTGTLHTIRQNGAPSQLSAKTTAKWVLIGFGCTYMVNYVFSFFFLFLQAIFQFEMNTDATAALVSSSNWLDQFLTFLLTAVSAPLLEELLFRGSILAEAKRYGNWFALILSSVCFGLAHGNYQQMFYAAAMGFFAGYLYLRSRSIFPPIFLHFSLNLVGACQGLLLGGVDLDALLAEESLPALMESLPSLAGILIIALACLVLAILGTVLFIVELIRNRSQFRLQEEEPEFQLSRGEKAAGVLTSPVMIIFAGVILALILVLAV